MTYTEFKFKYNGKYCDYHYNADIKKKPNYSYECKFLFNAYNRDVVGAKRTYGDAWQLWENYDRNKYTRITNTLTFVPRQGDVMVWKPWSTNPYGHVAIVDNANILWFNAFGQNWPLGSACIFKIFKYFNPSVYGVLRPK